MFLEASFTCRSWNYFSYSSGYSLSSRKMSSREQVFLVDNKLKGKYTVVGFVRQGENAVIFYSFYKFRPEGNSFFLEASHSHF